MSRTKKPLIKDEMTFRQAILFEGLQINGIGLSDIDAILELRNNYLVLFEVKKKGVDIPRGQRSMLETLVDVWEETGRVGIVVKATHTVKGGADILLKDCEVEETYYQGSWKELGGVNVKQFLTRFYKKNKIKLE